MLINDKRALAYIQKIAAVHPIEGADNIERVAVLGWNLIAKKGEFKVGDYCVYFEIDSKLPETDWSEFMRNKKFKVKTMKLGKFGVISQGLALPISILPEGTEIAENVDVTDLLEVTYAIVEDNARKADSIDKYKKMAGRHPKIFRKKPVRWLMKREWGKKLMFLFFGKKRDKRGAWPAWVKKTDEDRIQNLPFYCEDKDTKWFATEKIHGTSATYTIDKKGNFIVCSRNVVFEKGKKEECFYDKNVYIAAADLYPIEDALRGLKEKTGAEYVTIQGEVFGAGVQDLTYDRDGIDFVAFNLIFTNPDGSVERLNPARMTNMLAGFDIPCVPIVETDYVMPDTVEEVLDYAAGASLIASHMREGLVFRNENGDKSFKAVSMEYLLRKEK